VDALHQFHKRRRAANLETDLQAQLSLRLFPDAHGALGAADIHSHGFLAVNMLSRVDHSIQVLDVKKAGRRDLDDIDLLGRGELLISLRTLKHQFAIDARIALFGGKLVEMFFAFLELILEKIGQCDDARRRVGRERSRHFGTAPSAPEQPEAHGGVGCRAAHQFRFQNEQAGRGRRGAHKTAPVHLLIGIV